MIPDKGLDLSLLVAIGRAVQNNNIVLAEILKEKLTTQQAATISNKLISGNSSLDLDVKIICAISGH